MERVTNTYIALDLETTGISPGRDKIIEIAAIKVVDGCPVDSFCSFVNPARRLKERIIELTGITDAQLVEAPYIEDILEELLVFLEEYPLLGHKILFDYSFLKKAAVDNKISFEKQGIDTLKLARKYLPSLESKRLSALCEYYEISLKAHRAKEDALAAHMVYQRLKQDFCKEEEEACFFPEELHFSIKRDTPATRPQKERLYRLLQQHNITLEADVEKLTRSEASRITDKLLASFGR